MAVPPAFTTGVASLLPGLYIFKVHSLHSYADFTNPELLISYRPYSSHRIALLLAGNACFAQIDRAGLAGTVRDAADKRVAGAHIVVVQTATGLQRETVTSSNGTYDIPELPIGTYRLVCSAQGFEQASFENLELTVGHTRTLEITLGVAGITQQIDVSDAAGQLDETSAALGARIEPSR